MTAGDLRRAASGPVELAHPHQLAGASMGSGLTMSTQFSLEDPNALSGSRSCSDISITQQVAGVGMMLHVCIAQTVSMCTFSAVKMCGLRACFPWASKTQQHPSGEATDHCRTAAVVSYIGWQGPVACLHIVSRGDATLLPDMYCCK